MALLTFNLRKITKRCGKILYRHPLKSGISAAALLILSVLMLGSGGESLEPAKSESLMGVLTVLTAYNAVSVTFAAVGMLVIVKTCTANMKRIRPTWKDPPRYCLDLLLPAEEAEHRVAVLRTAFHKWRKIHPLNRARWIYITQCGGTICSFWVNWAMKKSGLIKALDRIFDMIGKLR